MGNSKFLPSNSGRVLNKSKEVAESLNKVSDAINEMATGYRGLDIENKDEENEKTNKQIFISELLNNLEPYKDLSLIHI